MSHRSHYRSSVKGKRGKVRRTPSRSTKKKKSKSKHRKTRRVTPLPKKVSVVPIIGPSKDTIGKTLTLARKHRKAGRHAKAALFTILAAAEASSLGPRLGANLGDVDRRMILDDYTSGPLANAEGQVQWHLANPRSNITHYTRRRGWNRRKPDTKSGKKKKGRRRRRKGRSRGGGLRQWWKTRQTRKRERKVAKKRREEEAEKAIRNYWVSHGVLKKAQKELQTVKNDYKKNQAQWSKVQRTQAVYDAAKKNFDEASREAYTPE